MSETKLVQTHCAVQGCKNTIFNKGPSILLHPFPTSVDMRNKWLVMLRSKCTSVNWLRSKICSKHFDNKCFDHQRKLKETAVPTLFPGSSSSSTIKKVTKVADNSPRDKIDRMLNTLTQAEITEDIRNTMRLIKVPDNFSDCVGDNLQCVPDTPVEAQLMLLIKKQDHLITRLKQIVMQNKKHVEVLQKNLEDSRTSKKEMEQSIESYKYIVKCLQEKHATLEEQIEILTAVESR